MSTTIQSGTKYLNHSLLGPNNDEKWYYYSELTVLGKHPNRTFSLDLYASDSQDLSVATLIGTKDIKTGVLTLNPKSASNAQQRDERSIQQKTKNSISYWEGKMGDAGLPPLTHQEKVTLGIASGNNNQSTTEGGTIQIKVTGEKPPEGETETPVTAVTGEDVANSLRDINVNIKGRTARSSYGNYYYPEDLAANKQDRIRFTMKFSEGTVVNATLDPESRVFQRRPPTKIGGSVTLPVVSGISDQNSVDWKGTELNPLQALGAGAALNLFENARDAGIAEAVRGIGGAAGELGREIRKKNAGTDIATAMNTYLAQQAVGTKQLLSRTTGAILNPNLEALFNAPQLRAFTFTFKLSPRDASEANQVKKIIRFFKQGMSVKTSDSNVFLKAPNVFDINYQTFDGATEITHPSINKIKTCALLSCDVQYTPDGTYMTYDDPARTMTSYQLNLQFNELDPIYDKDYTELDDDQDTTLGY